MKKIIIFVITFFPYLSSIAQENVIDNERESIRYSEFVKSELPNYLKSRPTSENNHLISAKNRIDELSKLAEKIDEREKIKHFNISTAKSNIWNETTRNPNSGGTIPAAFGYFVGPKNIVNPANGELLFSAEDIAFPKRRDIGISFKRTYSSLYRYDGPLGFGWDHEYNSRIILESGKIEDSQKITLWLNGQEIVFKKGGNEWRTLDTYKLQLKIDNGYIDIYNKDWDRIRFEKSSKETFYRLHSISGKLGDYKVNFVKMKYAQENNADVLSEISDHYGNRLELSYNEFGQIEAVSDRIRLIKFKYSGNKLVEATNDSVFLSFDKNAKSLTSIYDYKSNDNSIVLSSKKEFFEKVPTSFEYDKYGRVLSIMQGNVTDRRWNITYHGNSTECIHPFPSPKLKYFYDTKVAGGFLPIKVSVGTNSDTTTYSYDDSFNLIRRISPIGTISDFKYQDNQNQQNLNGLCVEEKIQSASEYKNIYDAKIKRISYLNNTALPVSIKTIQLKKGVESVAKEETFSYNRSGLLEKHNDGGIEHKYFYNKFGNLSVVLDANNSASIYYYADNYIQKEKFAHENGKIDGNGLLLRKIDDADADRINNILQKLVVDLHIEKKVIPSVNLETLYSYNYSGLQMYVKQGDIVSVVIYNSQNIPVIKYDSDKGIKIFSLDENLNTYRVFSEASQKSLYTEKIESYLPFVKVSGTFYFSEYEYNDFGECIRETKTNETFYGKKMSYQYERYSDGRLRSISNPLGIVRNDQYNENGLLTSHYLSNSSDKFVIESDFKYYPDGIVKSYKDRLGNRWENSIDGFGDIVETKTPDGHIISREFDVLGNLINEKTVSKYKLIKNSHSEYTQFGALKKKIELNIQGEISDEIITEENCYDKVGNKIKYRTTRNGSFINNIYDGLNRNIISVSPNGDLHYSVFDGQYRIIDATGANIDDEIQRFLLKYDYFDSFGQNICTLLAGKDGKVAMQQSIFRKYAANGMLLEETIPQKTRKIYEYDTIGNNVKETTMPFSREYGESDIEIESSFNAANQIVRKLVKNRALVFRNVMPSPNPELIDAPQETIYEYDTLGRLFRETNPDGLILTKNYNNYSLPSELKWAHSSDAKTPLRQLCLSYTIMGQVSEFRNSSGDVIRKMCYDDYGNCNISEDTSVGKNVKVMRQYSSLGSIVSESVEINGRKLPSFEIFNDLPNGLSETKWNFSNTEISSKNWNIEKIGFDTENRPCNLYLNSDEFVNWKYINGNIDKREWVWEGVRTIYEYSPLNQLVSINLCSSSGENILDNKYVYNDAGEPYFCSYKSYSDKSSEFSSYTAFDHFGRMSAQNSESFTPNVDEVESRYKAIFDSGKSRLGFETIRRTYDSLNNNWLTYTGLLSKTYNPNDFVQKEARIVSPSDIISGSPTLLQMKDMASNRDVTIAEFHEEGDNPSTMRNKKYDKLGNLIEYDGRFYNGDMYYGVKWTLVYDILGRLEKIYGTANDDESTSFEKGRELVELNFVYDSYNRRIVKQVVDKTRKIPVKRESFTVYKNNLQCLVLDELKDSKLFLREQYLWGNGERELISAILPSDNDVGGEMYYFYQDKGFNIIATLKRVADELKIIDSANYIGFGENATISKIKRIKTSLTDNPINPERVVNGRLDDTGLTKWHNHSNKNNIDYFEIVLTESSVLESMKLWAVSFPQNFFVYIVNDSCTVPQLLDSIKENGPYLKDKFVGERSLQVQKNCNEIYLGGRRGQKIIVVWNSEAFNRDIELAQIEIRGCPKAKSPIAFAGQWLDIETGLYYQINRYRPQDSDKFISPDPIGYLGGNNLYAYANANPLEWHDPDGEFPHILIGAGIGAIVSGGWYLFDCWWNEKEFDWGEFGIYTMSGAIAGAITAALPIGGTLLQDIAMGAIGGGIYGSASEGGITYYRTENLDASISDAIGGGIRGTIAGGISGGFFHLASKALNSLNGSSSQKNIKYESKIDRNEFNKAKKEFWQRKGNIRPEKNPAYVNTRENRMLMKRGRAPIGRDGFPTELHHPTGEVVPLNEMDILTRTEHRLGENYKLNHPFIFN